MLGDLVGPTFTSLFRTTLERTDQVNGENASRDTVLPLFATGKFTFFVHKFSLFTSFPHLPGGQGSYDDPTEADPCFAKVVPGYEHVVERMHKSEVKPGAYNHMVHNIAIRHMRLLSKEEAEQRISEQKK